MTTANTPTKAPLPPVPGRFRLPDIPERAPDEKITGYDHLHRFGMANSVAVYLGNPDTTRSPTATTQVAQTFLSVSKPPALLSRHLTMW